MNEIYVVGKKQRGISLIELIVCALLMFMLFYYIYKLLAPGLRVWRQSEKRVCLQQSNLVSMYRVTNDLKETNKYSVSLKRYDKATMLENLNGDGYLICFASARDQNGTYHTRQVQYGTAPAFDSGEPEWQKYVIYYIDNSRRIRRYETPTFTPYKDPVAMTINGDVFSIITPSNLSTNSVISRNVGDFTADYSPDPPNASTFKGLRIVVSAWYDDPDPREQFKTALETTVGVRYLEKE
jgi:hypothetical protein